MLSNFQSGGRALIQILLLGQPEFREQLDHGAGLEQLRQRVIASHHLTPMEANEVEPYIVHRLAVVGWQGRPAFDPSAFAAIFRETDGVPRRINQLATRLLLFASVEGLDRIDGAAVTAVASDMTADSSASQEKVLPLRSARLAAVPEATASNESADRRIAQLEARLEEQEAALRRVLTLLVDWVENGQQASGYRTNVA
jgi:general secretion pathway protein A